MVKKVVIPAAGLGTRLLPATKETPKEMLPIFVQNKKNEICLKPMLQAIFEQLYDIGLREFYFIVGRGKRAITDHFLPDQSFLDSLKKINKHEIADELEDFYKKVESSAIVFVNQPQPKGFGDAVLRVKSLIDEDFLVFAGDTYIVSLKRNFITSLIEAHKHLRAEASFVVAKVENPRQYGVMEGERIEEDLYNVLKVVEKPKKPQSNLAIMPVYLFNTKIFKALESTQLGHGGEIQLTDGIQKLVDRGSKVIAMKLDDEDLRFDIGNPESCWEAMSMSYKYFKNLRNPSPR